MALESSLTSAAAILGTRNQTAKIRASLLWLRGQNAGAQGSGDWAGIGSLVERLGAELAKIADTVPA